MNASIGTLYYEAVRIFFLLSIGIVTALNTNEDCARYRTSTVLVGKT